jgi:hypothetical protein
MRPFSLTPQSKTHAVGRGFVGQTFLRSKVMPSSHYADNGYWAKSFRRGGWVKNNPCSLNRPGL